MLETTSLVITILVLIISAIGTWCIFAYVTPLLTGLHYTKERYQLVFWWFLIFIALYRKYCVRGKGK